MRHLIAGLFAAGLTATAAFGDEPAAEYTAEDIVRGLTAGTPEAGDTLGGTRGVCFGTTEECADGGAENGGGAGTVTAGGGDVTPTTTTPPASVNLLITFQFGSDDLTPQAQANLREFARAIRLPELEAHRFTIDGHTDAVGSDSYNEALSLRRARAVVDFLTSLGVPRDRLQAVGHGERALYDPARPDADINRRVEAAIAR